MRPPDAFQTETPPPAASVRQPGFSSILGVKESLMAELLAGHAGGAPARAEELLARWPIDPDSDPDAAGLLLSDFGARLAAGERPDPHEYSRRFPSHRSLLSGLFSQHVAATSKHGSSAPGGRVVLPKCGDEIFGFRLWHELGAGAFARVFLAEQTGLAGRPVVLKTSDCTGDEPQTLAQLRHTNIVPVYSVHESAAGLRAVCMPYFGGASLFAVLRSFWANTIGKLRGGAEFLAALDDKRAPSLSSAKAQAIGSPPPPAAAVNGRTPRDELRGLNGVQVAAWVVARLAHGLQHAHDQGILHRDVKPSNVLIGDDGQPMLLDFNLSTSAEGDGKNAPIGGTIAYMSPEHLRAIGSRTPDMARLVDQRSDIYSLGMVLFEMLTGNMPFEQGGSYSPMPVIVEAMAVERERTVPSARGRREEIPWGMESIVRKCLAPNPAHRYRRAEHLAEDLDRFLADRPLAHAPELSLRERAAKWARRHPRFTSTGSVVAATAVLLALAAGTLVGVNDHLAEAREGLAAARSQERRRAYEAGTVRASMLVNVETDLQEPVQQGRAVCEETLGLYQVLDRDDWETHSDWRRLEPADRARVAADTRELLLSLAWARVRLAKASPESLAEALRLVDKAEAVADLPSSPGLWHDRALYLRMKGDEAAADFARAQTAKFAPIHARDHYLLATSLIRGGEPNERPRAIDALNRAVALEPRYYWAWFQRGVCHLHCDEHQLAASDFGVCVGLWPEFAWGHFNLGLAHDRAGRKSEAVAAYTAALARTPDFPDALLNRGLIHLERKEFDAALSNFTAVLGVHPEDAAIQAGRGMALEGLGRSSDADRAFERALALLPAAPEKLRPRILLEYASAIGRRRPQSARKAYETVLREHPRNADAFYGLSMVAAEADNLDDAIGCLDRCLAVAPDRKDAVLGRAILLARAGRFPEAIPVVDRCLDRDPNDGAVLYAGACIAALAAKKWAGTDDAEKWSDRAIDLLRRASTRGPARDRAARDPDLATIRSRPEFSEILAGWKPPAS